MGAPLSVENSTESTNEAAQSGLRPGHPCGVPPDKPAPPPAQMAGLRPGTVYQRRVYRRAVRSEPSSPPESAQESRRGVFLQVCRVRQGEAQETRLRRFLELSTPAETVLRMHCRRDTPPPRRPMAVEREKGACSAYHPSPRPSRWREGSESPSVVRGAAGGALRFLVCPLPVSVGRSCRVKGPCPRPFGLRAAPTP